MSFNGAMIFQSWKLGVIGDFAAREIGFNGAMIFQSWKLFKLIQTKTF
jgi:hypothetical protein